MSGGDTVTVRSGDATLAVELIGDHGPLVVCWPAGGRPGSDLAPLGVEVAGAGYRVALITPRGCDGSHGPTAGLSQHQLAADAAAVIELLDPAGGYVLGHAFGNRVMRCLAADRPQLVRGVILLAAGGMVPPENLDDLAIVADRDRTPGERRDAMRRAFFEPTGDPGPWLQSAGPRAAELYRTHEPAPDEHWWSGGSAPMLIVQGGRDRSAPPANGRRLAEAHPDRVTLVTIPDAAHALAIERPHEVAQHVIGWLEQQAVE